MWNPTNALKKTWLTRSQEQSKTIKTVGLVVGDWLYFNPIYDKLKMTLTTLGEVPVQHFRML